MSNIGTAGILKTSVIGFDSLQSALYDVFLNRGVAVEGFEVMSRRISINKGTFPAEIVTCKLSQGNEVIVLCKYAPKGNKRYEELEYEGMIYNSIINHIQLPKIECYKKLYFGENGHDGAWLVLEYLENSVQLISKEPDSFYKAAEWIARFHNLFDSKPFDLVKVYHEVFYLSILNYVQSLAENLDSRFSWFLELCSFFSANIKILTAPPQTLIHGEFYGKNILVKDNIIYPVDWETAAIGPAEMDLAALTDGKDETRANFAISGYKAERWSNQTIPESFELRLLLAKIFYPLHWVEEWQLDFVQFEKWMNSSNFGGKLNALWHQSKLLS